MRLRIPPWTLAYVVAGLNMQIREDVMHMYADGTISKRYFETLDKQISMYEERFFKRTPI